MSDLEQKELCKAILDRSDLKRRKKSLPHFQEMCYKKMFSEHLAFNLLQNSSKKMSKKTVIV